MVKTKFDAMTVDTKSGRLMKIVDIEEGMVLTNVWQFAGGRWEFDVVIRGWTERCTTFNNLAQLVELRQVCREGAFETCIEEALLGNVA